MNFYSAARIVVALAGVNSKARAKLGDPDSIRRLANKNCVHGFVPCEHGIVAGSGTYNGESCVVACNGRCCQGEDACTHFTGTVCMDGSCNGKRSCCEANIGLVSESCKGDYSCDHVAHLPESELDDFAKFRVFRAKKSCNGLHACEYAACDHGHLDLLDDSCNGDYACDHVAQYNYEGGIGSMRHVCNGDHACCELLGHAPGGPNDPPGGATPFPPDSTDAVNCCNAPNDDCRDDANHDHTLPFACAPPNCTTITSSKDCEKPTFHYCFLDGNGPSAECLFTPWDSLYPP